MVIKASKRGEFLACSGYPKCKNTKSFTRDAAGKITIIEKPEPVATDIKCEKCGSPMLIRNSRRGPFLACSGYPKCRNAKPLPEGRIGCREIAPEMTAPAFASAQRRDGDQQRDERRVRCGIG